MNSSENIGGFPYILDYLHIYLPYSFFSLVAAILGLIGNVFVVAAVLVDQKLRRNPTCILITNLAFSDLVISVFVHPSIIVGVFFGKNFFDRNVSLCVFLGAICLIACSTSLITMGFLAINRYACIFKLRKFRKYFSVKNTMVLSVIAWICGVLVDMPNFFGIGDHIYDLKVLSCHFDRLKAPYTITFCVTCIIIPCICIGIIYLKIFLRSAEIRNRIKMDHSSKRDKNALKAIKIAKSLFASFFVFTVCWLPMSIVMIVGIEDQLPIWIHTFSNLTAHFNSTLNPIVYLIFNPKIRQAYCNVIRLMTCNRFLNDYPGLYSSSARLTGTYCIRRINRLTNKQTIISL